MPITVPIKPGPWFRALAPGGVSGAEPAAKEDIMMVLDNIKDVLIK